jgi:hypothetical protein
MGARTSRPPKSLPCRMVSAPSPSLALSVLGTAQGDHQAGQCQHRCSPEPEHPAYEVGAYLLELSARFETGLDDFVPQLGAQLRQTLLQLSRPRYLSIELSISTPAWSSAGGRTTSGRKSYMRR